MSGEQIPQEPITAAEVEKANREAHFYATLADFEELMNQYGADHILKEMKEEPFWQLYHWFAEAFKDAS